MSSALPLAQAVTLALSRMMRYVVNTPTPTPHPLTPSPPQPPQERANGTHIVFALLSLAECSLKLSGRTHKGGESESVHDPYASLYVEASGRWNSRAASYVHAPTWQREAVVESTEALQWHFTQALQQSQETGSSGAVIPTGNTLHCSSNFIFPTEARSAPNAYVFDFVWTEKIFTLRKKHEALIGRLRDANLKMFLCELGATRGCKKLDAVGLSETQLSCCEHNEVSQRILRADHSSVDRLNLNALLSVLWRPAALQLRPSRPATVRRGGNYRGGHMRLQSCLQKHRQTNSVQLPGTAPTGKADRPSSSRMKQKMIP
ncbi:hypothetical protein Q8A73_023184 [Channa argus]|nr:hypothetical protein Q8A73_023184 [Channa argus]